MFFKSLLRMRSGFEWPSDLVHRTQVQGMQVDLVKTRLERSGLALSVSIFAIKLYKSLPLRERGCKEKRLSVIVDCTIISVIKHRGTGPTWSQKIKAKALWKADFSSPVLSVNPNCSFGKLHIVGSELPNVLQVFVEDEVRV